MVFEDTLTIERTEVQVKPEKVDMSQKDVNFIVLAVNSPYFGIDKPSFNLDVCGKTMIEWVENACALTPTVKQVPFKFDLLKEIKPLLNNSTWTVVLFSDSPLLTRKTVENAFSIAEQKGLNVLKLTRGYVFNTEYISRVEEIFGTETYYLEEEDFIVASSFKQLSIVRDIMKGRICDYFMRNGVDVVDPSSTFIGANVSIAKNTTIMPMVKLLGRVNIGQNCRIESGSVLKNCVVGDKSLIENSSLRDCVLGEETIVQNSILEDVVLGEGSVVKSNSVLNKVSAKGRLGVEGAVLRNVKTEGNVDVKTGAVLLSENGVVKMFGNNTVGIGAKILAPVSVGQNVCIKDGEEVRKDMPAVKID